MKNQDDPIGAWYSARYEKVKKLREQLRELDENYRKERSQLLAKIESAEYVGD